MAIEDFFDAMDDHCAPSKNPLSKGGLGSACFSWSAKGCGFGEFLFYNEETDGEVNCTAIMNTWIKNLLRKCCVKW